MYQRIKNHKILLLLLLISFTSCDEKCTYDQYSTIRKGSWDAKKPISFQFNVNDTLLKKNLFINLRNNNEYPFSNLFIITKIKFPNNYQIIDTLEYDMADKTGKFLGQGFTDIKENKLIYKENITFPNKGKYIIEITQAMRKNGKVEGVKSLKGITEVGFRIEKIN